MAVSIVMGTPGSGKTHFIKTHFHNYIHLSVGEYQNKLKESLGNPTSLESGQYKELLKKANEQIKEDMLRLIAEGKDVVMEHTLYKAKRRIVYIEAFKAITDEPIDIYVMQPSDKRLMENIKLKDGMGENDFRRIKNEAESIEFTNTAEGFSKIYSVIDGEIKERIDAYDEKLVAKAKEELRIEELKEKEAKEKLEHKKFWHYCEVCGKKQLLTSEEAYNAGWDYPPTIGMFGVLSPRTCGKCGMVDTVYWKLVTGGINQDKLTDEQIETIERIKGEPFNLLSSYEEIAGAANIEMTETNH